MVGERAYTRELFTTSFGEQDPTVDIATPAATPTVWPGKVRTLGGLGQENKLDMHYFAGGGRVPFEAVDLGVDINGTRFAWEVQDGYLLALAFGTVIDTGSTPTNPTTLSVQANAGATQITVVSATGYAVNDFVQVDVASLGEVRKITAVVANVLTLDKALRRKHLAGVAVNEVVAPFTHTFNAKDDYPIPFTLQVVFRAGFSNELAWQIAGCHFTEISLGHDDRDVLVAEGTIAASKIINVTPPAALPTKRTLKSYRYADSLFTYFGSALDGVISHSMRVANGGGMEYWSRPANGEFAAEYIPGRAVFEQEVRIIARNNLLSTQLLARSASGVAGDVLYTRGTNDTLDMQMLGGGVVRRADHDVPDEGKVTVPLKYNPFDHRVVIVSSDPWY